MCFSGCSERTGRPSIFSNREMQQPSEATEYQDPSSFCKVRSNRVGWEVGRNSTSSERTQNLLSDTLYFGWQDGKFVLLVTQAGGCVKHRVSLTPEEAGQVLRFINRPSIVNAFNSVEFHQQVDTDEEFAPQSPAHRAVLMLSSRVGREFDIDRATSELLEDYESKTEALAAKEVVEHQFSDFMEALAVTLKKANALTMQGALDEAALLRSSLEESVKLQSHYAKMLNVWDEGERRLFLTAEEWIKRVKEVQENVSNQ